MYTNSPSFFSFFSFLAFLSFLSFLPSSFFSAPSFLSPFLASLSPFFLSFYQMTKAVLVRRVHDGMTWFTYTSGSNHRFGNIIQVDGNKGKFGNKIVLDNNNVLNKIQPSKNIGNIGHFDVFLM